MCWVRNTFTRTRRYSPCNSLDVVHEFREGRVHMDLLPDLLKVGGALAIVSYSVYMRCSPMVVGVVGWPMLQWFWGRFFWLRDPGGRPCAPGDTPGAADQGWYLDRSPSPGPWDVHANDKYCMWTPARRLRWPLGTCQGHDSRGRPWPGFANFNDYTPADFQGIYPAPGRWRERKWDECHAEDGLQMHLLPPLLTPKFIVHFPTLKLHGEYISKLSIGSMELVSLRRAGWPGRGLYVRRLFFCLLDALHFDGFISGVPPWFRCWVGAHLGLFLLGSCEIVRYC